MSNPVDTLLGKRNPKPSACITDADNDAIQEVTSHCTACWDHASIQQTAVVTASANAAVIPTTPAIPTTSTAQKHKQPNPHDGHESSDEDIEFLNRPGNVKSTGNCKHAISHERQIKYQPKKIARPSSTRPSTRPPSPSPSSSEPDEVEPLKPTMKDCSRDIDEFFDAPQKGAGKARHQCVYCK